VRPGDALPRIVAVPGVRSFNPRPAVRPGDALRQAMPTVAAWIVSIRARP